MMRTSKLEREDLVGPPSALFVWSCGPASRRREATLSPVEPHSIELTTEGHIVDQIASLIRDLNVLSSELGRLLVSNQFFGCLSGKFFRMFKGEAFLDRVKNAVRISDADVEACHDARTRTGR